MNIGDWDSIVQATHHINIYKHPTISATINILWKVGMLLKHIFYILLILKAARCCSWWGNRILRPSPHVRGISWCL